MDNSILYCERTLCQFILGDDICNRCLHNAQRAQSIDFARFINSSCLCCIEPSLFERGHESFFIDLKEETLLLLLLVIIASPQSRATGGQHASLNLFTNPTAN